MWGHLLLVTPFCLSYLSVSLLLADSAVLLTVLPGLEVRQKQGLKLLQLLGIPSRTQKDNLEFARPVDIGMEVGRDGWRCSVRSLFLEIGPGMEREVQCLVGEG